MSVFEKAISLASGDSTVSLDSWSASTDLRTVSTVSSAHSGKDLSDLAKSNVVDTLGAVKQTAGGRLLLQTVGNRRLNLEHTLPCVVRVYRGSYQHYVVLEAERALPCARSQLGFVNLRQCTLQLLPLPEEARDRCGSTALLLLRRRSCDAPPISLLVPFTENAQDWYRALSSEASGCTEAEHKLELSTSQQQVDLCSRRKRCYSGLDHRYHLESVPEEDWSADAEDQLVPGTSLSSSEEMVEDSCYSNCQPSTMFCTTPIKNSKLPLLHSTKSNYSVKSSSVMETIEEETMLCELEEDMLTDVEDFKL